MSEAFGDRLRRLRKDAGAGVNPRPVGGEAESAAPTPLPAWFRERLGRGRDPGTAPATAVGTLGGPRGLVEFRGARGVGTARVSRWELEHSHGAVPLASALQARGSDLALLGVDARLEALELGRALFLDIETTGLAGGAGTKAFLVGLGRFTAQGFELWQGFLRGPEDEAALLDECARQVGEAGALVSFFGKSFDRHRLEDKMRVHGIAAPFERCLHLDLYHPCRRLFGPGLADGRLATMEREIAGVERTHDLAGAFAPAAWYDFLAGRPHRLEEVFAHNRDDILSLVALAAELARRVGEAEREGWTPGRALTLARCAERLRRWSDCRDWARRARFARPAPEELRGALELEARATECLGDCEALSEIIAMARAAEEPELLARLERRLVRTIRRSRGRAEGSGS